MGNPVKKFRLTRKVKEACLILSDNPITDLGEGVLEERIQKGKLDYHRVYDAMYHFGYDWNEKRQCWYRKLPYWLQKIEEEELRKIE